MAVLVINLAVGDKANMPDEAPQTSRIQRNPLLPRTSKKVNWLLLIATMILVLAGHAAASVSGGVVASGGSTKQKEQVDGCLRHPQTPEIPMIPVETNEETPDPTWKKYGHDIYGGLTCCGKDHLAEITDNMVSTTGASVRGLYGICGQCAETWEYMFFAAACSPQQESFLKKFDNNTYYTLIISKNVALALWDGCKDDDELTVGHGTHGRPLKYVYNDPSTYEGVSWDANELKAKYYVEDLIMAHTPPIYLKEATERVHIKVATPEEEPTSLQEGNFKTNFRIKPFCAESGHPITDITAGILIRLLLLFSGTWLANFLHLKHVSWLPESGVFIVFGLIYGSVILGIKGSEGALDLAFDATQLNLVLLPPIIFYSGFSMHHSNFGANIMEILILAAGGTLIVTFGIGFGLFYARDLGIGDFPASLNIFEALAFGALISAVDPVATLATFDALQVDPNVEVLIFGESLLNDAVAIVLYKSFAQFAENGGITAEFGLADAGIKFVTLTFGSLFVGLIMTVVQALVFKFTFFKHTPVLEILIFMFCAYSSYLGAELFHWSGIIASLGHGVGCALYVKPNMSQEGHFRAELISHSLAALADMLIFIMVGSTGVVTITSVFDISWALTCITLFLCLFLRGFSTALLIPPLNLCRKKSRQIKKTEAFLMWWSGLRGAIAIGLVASIPSSLRAPMMSATCLIVFFTVFVLGGGTSAVLKKMGIKMGINKPPANGKLNPILTKLHLIMQKFLTNQDENDDGIDDRYQSKSYSREMSRRGSIISSTLERSGTINVLQGVDLANLQAASDAAKDDNATQEEDSKEAQVEDSKESESSTLNWE